jgi:hypothetical protein
MNISSTGVPLTGIEHFLLCNVCSRNAAHFCVLHASVLLAGLLTLLGHNSVIQNDQNGKSTMLFKLSK